MGRGELAMAQRHTGAVEGSTGEKEKSTAGQADNQLRGRMQSNWVNQNAVEKVWGPDSFGITSRQSNSLEQQGGRQMSSNQRADPPQQNIWGQGGSEMPTNQSENSQHGKRWGQGG